MSSIDWRRAQSVFERIIEVPAAEREPLIDELCGDDRELADAVRGLLEQDGRADALIDQTPVTAMRRAIIDEMGQRWIGRSVGAYRILDKIGHGGMGQVFLAEREDQAFSKRVAIKVMSAANPSSLERFHRERQILADLEHPGIARLLDGGTTTDGLPYVVMELVEGVTLTQYCDAGRLALGARLRIFLDVCQAVQFAHRNLVVHRDLKPSNILVTPAGEPKLLDFGIAKLLTPAEAAGDVTLAADRAMTLDYASPEQLTGAPVTTATDVYSLGVVLYLTLTGELPGWRAGARTRGTEDTRTSAVPPAPSAVVARRSRVAGDPEPAVAARALRGDLDNILLKALRTEPAERYPSVEAFTGDLRRYLEGLPVEARAPSFGYRASKFIRRHVLAVASATLIAILLLAFGVVTLVQSRRLQSERDTSQQALAFLVDAFRGADPAVNLGREVTARDILNRGAERIEAAEGPPTSVQQILMHTLGQIHASLGSYQEARAWLEKSLAAGESLHGSNSPLLAPVLKDLGEVLLTTGEFSAAEAAARRALDLRLPEQPALRIQSLHTLAEAKAAQGEMLESVDIHSEALALARQRLAESDPQLGMSLSAVSRAKRRLGQLPAAAALASETLELQRRFRPGDSPETARLLASSGLIQLAIGDLEHAREDSLAALEMRLRLFDENHDSVARNLKTLGRIADREGRLEEADDLLSRSLEIFRTVLGDDNLQTVGARFQYANHLHARMGMPARAEPVYHQAIAGLEAVEGSESSSQMAALLAGLASALNDLGRHGEAESYWRQALGIRLAGGSAGSEQELSLRTGLAAALTAQGRYEPAETEYSIVWRTLSERDGANDPAAQDAGGRLAELLGLSGRAAAASELREQLAEARKTPDR